MAQHKPTHPHPQRHKTKHAPTHTPSLVHHKASFGSKRLLMVFFAIVLIVTGSIAYYNLSKTTLTITRAHFPVRATFITSVREDVAEDASIEGTFDINEISHTYATDVSGEVTTLVGKSSGTIRVINTWNKNQPLQETTRFLSPDGILFRTTEFVDVPAGGEASVSVIADEEGARGDIAADTTFTIPGLWAGLQESIYGVNDAAFTGGESEVSYVTQKQIDEAQEIALEELKQKAQLELSRSTNNLHTITVFRQLLVNQANVPAGSPAEQLSLTLRGQFIVMSFNPDTLNAAIYEKLLLKITDDEELVSIDLSQLETEVDRISDDGTTLQIRMSAVGYAQNKPTSTLFLPNTYTGMTETALQEFANQETGIGTITASFSPFWVTQTPDSAQRLRIDIQ